MTTEEKEIVKALSNCTFQVGSFEKRFVNSLSVSPEKELTEKQKTYLHKLLYRYRKQTSNLYLKYQKKEPHTMKEENDIVHYTKIL